MLTRTIKFLLPLQSKCQTVFQSRQRGATAVEYALMVALIATVIVVAVKLLGTSLTTVFNKATAF